MQLIDNARRGADRVQRRSRPVGFVVGVLLRYRDDQGSRWASLIAYYGFISIFPLLLSFVTVLGIVLKNHTDWRESTVNSALGRFPVIGTQLQVQQLDGKPLVVAFGVLAAMWAGLRAVQVMQDAMNRMWCLPPKEQPNFVVKRVRSVAMLVVLGVSITSSAAVTGIASRLQGHGVMALVFTMLGSAVVNVVLLAGAYRILPRRRLSVAEVAPGAVFAGIGVFGLQLIGAWYVARVQGSSDTYGVFATVIGLLAWLSLQSQVVLLGNEVNVVRANRYWPRSLVPNDPTEADMRALTDSVTREIAVKGIEIDVSLRPAPDDAPDAAAPVHQHVD